MHEAEPQNISSKSLPESQRLSRTVLRQSRRVVVDTSMPPQNHPRVTTGKSTTLVHRSSPPADDRADREIALRVPALHRAMRRDRRPATLQTSLLETQVPST